MGWAKEEHDTWKVVLPNSFFGGFNPYADLIRGDWFRPEGREHHTGAVYLNGHWLVEAAKLGELMKPAGKQPLWFATVDESHTTITAQFPDIDPNRDGIEINVRQAVFYPGKTGCNFITVRGFTLEHAATNWAPPTAEQVGIKFHGAIDTVISDNHIYRAGRGIWLDWMAQGTRVTRNLVQDIAPREDLFVEVNNGPFVVDHNLFLSGFSLLDVSQGGAYAHNLFAGRIKNSPELISDTPWLEDHGTKIAGLATSRAATTGFITTSSLARPGSTAMTTPRFLTRSAATLFSWVPSRLKTSHRRGSGLTSIPRQDCARRTGNG